jgi:hypothetical protein
MPKDFACPGLGWEYEPEDGFANIAGTYMGTRIGVRGARSNNNGDFIQSVTFFGNPTAASLMSVGYTGIFGDIGLMHARSGSVTAADGLITIGLFLEFDPGKIGQLGGGSLYGVVGVARDPGSKRVRRMCVIAQNDGGADQAEHGWFMLERVGF